MYIKYLKNILFPLLLISPNLALAFYPTSLHLGADYKHFGARPRAEYRDNFPQIHEGANLYGGLRFGLWQNWDWGIDIGWERSNLTTQRTGLFNQRFFNRNAANGDISHVETRFQGWHTDLNIYKSLIPCYFDLILTGGITIQKPHANIYYTPTATGITEDYYVTNDSKVIGRLGFGAQWMFLKWFGIKGLVSWSNDHRFTYHGQQFNPANARFERFEAHPYKSTMSFYLGVVARTSGITELPKL